MLPSRVVHVLRAPALLVLFLGACRESAATTAPDRGGASGGTAPAGKPAPRGSYADLAGRFAQACDQPGGAGKDEAASLAAPLLEAASRRLSELSITHEVTRDDRAALISINAESGSPLGRLAESLRSTGDTRLVYDVGHFRDHPERPTGYDEQANVVRMPHAVILRGGDPDEPNLRHAQARVEAWAPYRRGESSPYTARLVDAGDAARVHRVDELHAWTSDLARELQGVLDVLISPDDAPLTQADLRAVLAAREGGPAIARPLTDFEARWDRLANAALLGATGSARIEPAIRQAQAKAKGKTAAQFSPGPRGVTALLDLEPPKDGGPGFALFVDMAESAGPDDPKNLALLRARLAETLKVVERHGPHFAAVVEVLRRVAATPSGAERRALLKALAEIIAPAPADAPAKARTQAAYAQRFDQALQGKTPKR